MQAATASYGEKQNSALAASWRKKAAIASRNISVWHQQRHCGGRMRKPAKNEEISGGSNENRNISSSEKAASENHQQRIVRRVTVMATYVAAWRKRRIITSAAYGRHRSIINNKRIAGEITISARENKAHQAAYHGA